GRVALGGGPVDGGQGGGDWQGQAGRDLRALREGRALHVRGGVAVVVAGVAARRCGGVRAVAAAVVDRAGRAATRARGRDDGAGGGRSLRRLRRARGLVTRRRAAVRGEGGEDDGSARTAGHARAVGAAQLPDREGRWAARRKTGGAARQLRQLPSLGLGRVAARNARAALDPRKLGAAPDVGGALGGGAGRAGRAVGAVADLGGAG